MRIQRVFSGPGQNLVTFSVSFAEMASALSPSGSFVLPTFSISCEAWRGTDMSNRARAEDPGLISRGSLRLVMSDQVGYGGQKTPIHKPNTAHCKNYKTSQSSQDKHFRFIFRLKYSTCFYDLFLDKNIANGVRQFDSLPDLPMGEHENISENIRNESAR